MAHTVNNEEDFEINSDIEESYQRGCESLVPKVSKARYEKTYDMFKKWLGEKKSEISEKTLLAYFVQRNSKLKSPGSLWAEYSMLKVTINLNNGIDISQFKKLLAFLKKKNIGHHPKKSKVFTREEMNKFLVEAPDETYIMMKAVMVMGVAGALRRDELVKMTVDDISDQGSVIIVNVPDTKTHISRSFTIIDKVGEKVPFLTILRKYIELRPKEANSRRFFYSVRQGKCVNQLVGINTIGQIPQKIAAYLKLQDPQSYTGHAFRRTSATLLANTGVDVMALKRHGGWRSSNVAESYVADSLTTKIGFADKILHTNSGAISNVQSKTVLEDKTTAICSNGNISNSISNTEDNTTAICSNSNISNSISNTETSITVKTVDDGVGRNITFNNCTNCNFHFYK